MNPSANPRLLDLLAASHALGTMHGAARRRFEALAREQPEVRAAALVWQARLAGISELQPAIAPDPAVWVRIQNLVDAEQRRQHPAPGRRGWLRSLALWRSVAAAGVFAAVLAAGEYISLQMGLSFAAFFDPSSGGQTMVVGRLLNMLAMLLFLAVDGHLLMLAALADSFQALPISDAPLASQGWLALALQGSHIFTSGLMLALPLVTALLTLNLAMGILNRASPQFSIFAVGFPLTLLAGIALMALQVPHLLQMLEPRFTAGLEAMAGVVQALRP